VVSAKAAEIEGEIVSEETRHLPAVIEGASLTVTPQVQAGELVARLAVIEEAMRTAMVPGVDYGVIPGTDNAATPVFSPDGKSVAFIANREDLARRRAPDGDLQGDRLASADRDAARGR